MHLRDRIAIGAFLFATAFVSFACDEERAPLPTGSGGSIGGEGGSGGSGGPDDPQLVRQLCERTCEVLVPCGRDYLADDAAECVADCVGGRPRTALMQECVDCLEAVSCDAARLACQHAPACDMAWDVRVSAANLRGLDGRTARILVVEAFENELWADFARDVTIERGAFDVTIAAGLPAWNVPFDVVVLVDADGDGGCKPANGDLAWRVKVGHPSGDVHVAIDADAHVPAPDACLFWDEAPTEIVLEGEGFASWDGAYAIATSVWVDDSFLTVGRFVSAPIENGTFRFRLGSFGDYVEDMAPGSELRVAWMVDLDGDWICSAADAGGSALLPPLSGLMQHTVAAPSEPGTAPCALLRGLGHDITLRGGGYDAFEGEKVEGVLLDARGVPYVRARGTVEAGQIRLVFAGGAVPGDAYSAAVWIDVDGDAACTPPEDGLWAFPVGAVFGDAERAIDRPGEPADPAVCRQFDMK